MLRLFCVWPNFSGWKSNLIKENLEQFNFWCWESETWDYVDVRRLLRVWMRVVRHEVSRLLRNGARQTDVTDWAAVVSVCVLWSSSRVSPQDGLVQAAALRKGLQRLLHQNGQQKGSQVSDGRRHVTRNKPISCAVCLEQVVMGPIFTRSALWEVRATQYEGCCSVFCM